MVGRGAGCEPEPGQVARATPRAARGGVAGESAEVGGHSRLPPLPHSPSHCNGGRRQHRPRDHRSGSPSGEGGRLLRDGPWLGRSAKEINHRHNGLAKSPSREAGGALEWREPGSKSASGTY